LEHKRARRDEKVIFLAPLHQTPSRRIAALFFAVRTCDSKVCLLAGYSGKKGFSPQEPLLIERLNEKIELSQLPKPNIALLSFAHALYALTFPWSASQTYPWKKVSSPNPTLSQLSINLGLGLEVLEEFY